MAGLFQVLWGQADGQFKAAEPLAGSDDKPLMIPPAEDCDTNSICTRPLAVDWDSDGDLDLVVGNFAGTFYVFSGEGTGKFRPEPTPILAGDDPLKVNGHHGDPFPVDWDGDGDLDLLSGSASGGVQWAENKAGPGEPPSLTRFESLIPGPGDEWGRRFEQASLLDESDLREPSGSTRVWVDDVNGDGKLDVLVGDSVTLVSLPEGMTAEESERRRKKWEADWGELTSQPAIVLTAPTEEDAESSDTAPTEEDLEREEREQEKQAEHGRRVSELYQARREFIVEERTGYVWLYLRK